MRILVFNCGSSSLKFELIEFAGQGRDADRLARGKFEELGPHAHYTITSKDGRKSEDDAPIADPAAAATRAIDWLQQAGNLALDAVAHRVVHGGEAVSAPIIADDEVMRALEQASQFAPLHNPPAIAAIRAAGSRLAGIPTVVVADTGFHRMLPPRARDYPLPHALSERYGLRRFGFHGIGHAWMLERCAALLGTAVEALRLITLHLGAGCSAAAIEHGHSVDTSMGLTPLEGLMMATRSGDIDPAIPGFLAEHEKISAAEVERILNHQSGLLGVSGISADLREIIAAAARNQRAALAIEMFGYRIRKYVGAYMATLGHADALVFGGGIGEHSDLVREQVCLPLERLGVRLDRERNRQASGREMRISDERSPVQVWVVPLDEELYIARAAAALLRNTHAPRP